MLENNQSTIDIFNGLTSEPLPIEPQNDLFSAVPGNGGLLETELPPSSIEAISSLAVEAIAPGENLLETPATDPLWEQTNNAQTDLLVGSEVVGEFDALTGELLANNNPTFTSGVFTVGQTGEVSFEFLFDGGWYQGELAIFSLEGIEAFNPGSFEFTKEASSRALSNSELGHVVISDVTEGAKFTNSEWFPYDFNAGEYQETQTFTMTPGDTFGMMLVPHGTVQQWLNDDYGSGVQYPVFSLGTENPDDGLFAEQIADVTGDGNTFAFEDVSITSFRADRDYTDVVFKLEGATGTVPLLDNVINPDKEWRDTAIGQELLDYVSPPDPPEYKPDELLVKFQAGATETDIQNAAAAAGAVNIEPLISEEPNSVNPLEQWYVAHFEPNADLEAAQTIFAGEAKVDAVDLDYVLYPDWVPNDPDFGLLWNLENTGQNGGTPDADINAPEAWDVQTGSRDVVVAVLDSGVDYNHQDLAANIWSNSGEIPGNGIDDDGNNYVDDVYGWDWFYDDNDPIDDKGHGTHVAGIIGAVGDNNLGVVGVSPEVSLMSLKFQGDFSGVYMGFASDAAKAIDYAVDNGADIINASFGGMDFSSVMFDALSRANDAGVLFVASAGNQSNDNDVSPRYPTDYDLGNVISVAATDNNDQLVQSSNYGATTVDVAAPGVDILSTVPGNGYELHSGTSTAAPHVAGAAALLLAEDGNLTATELKQTLTDMVTPVSSLAGITVSEGRLSLSEFFEEEPPPPKMIFATLIADNTGEFNHISATPAAVSDNGTVAFSAERPFVDPFLSRGIFSGNGETTMSRATHYYNTSNRQILTPAIKARNDFDINNSYQVAYRGDFHDTDGSITGGLFGPDGAIGLLTNTGPYAPKNAAVINNSGTVAYRGGYAGSIYGYGIFRDEERIAATKNVPARTFYSSFNSLSDPTMNDFGTVAFTASRTFPDSVVPGLTYSWPSGVDEGILIHSGGQFTLMADNSGVINDFGQTGSSSNYPPDLFYPIPPDINNNNTVAFVANLDTGDSGIFTSDGNSLTTIADSSGAFSSFSQVAINDNDRVAFFADLDSGGRGIFFGPDPIADRAVGVGDYLLGSTITSLSFSHKGLNNADQIAFYASLENGTEGIFRLNIY